MELSRTTAEQYEKLKELGFPINTTSKHPTPTVAFALMWLRETEQLFLAIDLGHDEDSHWFNSYLHKIKHDYDFDPINADEDLGGATHEEAESEGLDFAIKYLLEQKK